MIQNNHRGAALFTNLETFDGYSPAATDILIKSTYFGDSNLNGKADGSDYSLINNALTAQLADPSVSIAARVVTSVPGPASPGILGIDCGMMVRR